jgi:hypothetical protein
MPRTLLSRQIRESGWRASVEIDALTWQLKILLETATASGTAEALAVAPVVQPLDRSKAAADAGREGS